MPIGMFVHVQLCKHISLKVYRTWINTCNKVEKFLKSLAQKYYRGKMQFSGGPRNDKFVTTDYVKILSSCLMAAYAIT